MTNKEAVESLWPDFVWENLRGPLAPCLPQTFGRKVPSAGVCHHSSCKECEQRWLESEYEEEPQFTREQKERTDEVYNAVLEMCRKLTTSDEREVKYDIALLGPLADNIIEYLIQNGYEVYFPIMTTDEKGKTVIYNFYDH